MGQHSLGPHVVGQRIVVRHLLPDGSATDVLGVCTAWGEASLTVDRDGHGPVTIAPRRRGHRQARAAPRVGARPRRGAGGRAARRPRSGRRSRPSRSATWLLRASPPHGGRLRRRGNSALAMREPGIGWADAAFGVRRFYDALDQTPIVQVERGSSVETRLAPLGFAPVALTADLTADLTRGRRRRPRPARVRRPCAPVRAGGTRPTYARRSRSRPATRRRVAGRRRRPRGRGVLSGDWLLLESLAVDPAHRRRGLATAVLAELARLGRLARRARRRCCTWRRSTPAAIALYERLGFVTHHTNRYLVGR